MKLYLSPFLLAAAVAVSYENIDKAEWETFKQTHGKKYESAAEESYRMKVYRDNKAKIEQHNAEYQAGTHTFDMKMNQFGDMPHQEFTETVNGYYKPDSKIRGTFSPPASTLPPAEVDWRTKGAVTDVKFQMFCSSCYSFSATGAMEAQYFLKTGKLVSLSEQNLVDCTHTGKYWNRGCNGGIMYQAFQYVIDNKGIALESAYPYEGKVGECRYTNASSSGLILSGFVDIPQDEEKLRQAVAAIGPISVAFDGSQPSFQFYRSGVYSDPKCDPCSLSHAALIVGYGTDGQNNDYWIVKNSWTKAWGDQGYIYMARNKNNSCGIATIPSYPVVDSTTV